MPRWHPVSHYFPAPTEEPAVEDKRAWLMREVMAHRLMGRGHDWIATHMTLAVELVEELIGEGVKRVEQLTSSERKNWAAFGYEQLTLAQRTIWDRLVAPAPMLDPETGEQVYGPSYMVMKESDHAAMVRALVDVNKLKGILCGALTTGDHERDRQGRVRVGSQFAMGGDVGAEVDNDPATFHSRLEQLLCRDGSGFDKAKRVNKPNGSNGNGAHA